MTTRVAVVGGGIAGLAAAHALNEAGADVTLHEASDRLGGKVLTGSFCGLPVEQGPDCFLARVPWAVDLCRRVGLGEELVAPATGTAYVWARGRLRRLPDGLVLGAPARVGPLARSGLLSAAGVARAGLDLVLPRRARAGDPTVDEVIGGRFGREVVDRLADPLLGGINAGRADRLSLRAVAPDLADAADGRRSLLLGLRSRPHAADGPIFLTVHGGLSRLVERLAARLPDVRLGEPVVALRDLDADRVVLAVPAFAAALLLEARSSDAVGELRSIEHASVRIVTLAYRRETVAEKLDGTGFLVPRAEGWLVTACTWLSSKWSALATDDHVLVRASTGRFGDERALELEREALVERVHEELTRAMALSDTPDAWEVADWPRSFPQYEPGHLARVDRIEAALTRDAPGVVVAGAAYRGLGLASCIRQGEEASRKVLAA